MNQNTNTVIVLVVGLVLGVLVAPAILPGASYQTMMQPMGTGGHMGNSTDMGSAMDGMMMGMQDKTGDELDRAFLEGMIEHHQGAVAMAEMVRSSSRPEIRQMAEDIISAQTREIEMMKGWQNDWY